MASLTVSNQAPFKTFGHIVRFAQQASIDAGAIAASSQVAITGTLTGLKTDMLILVNTPTSTTNAMCVGGRCTAADTLELSYINPAGSATPTSGTYIIIGL